MNVTAEEKKTLFSQHSFSKKGTDTGSPESQIALFTERIQRLTKHLEDRKKDKATELGLKKLVGKRRKFLSYLERNNITRYRAIIQSLGIRK